MLKLFVQGKNFLQKVMNDERGQGMVEYGLIIAVVAVVVIVGLSAVSGQLNALFNSIVTKLTPAS